MTDLAALAKVLSRREHEVICAMSERVGCLTACLNWPDRFEATGHAYRRGMCYIYPPYQAVGHILVEHLQELKLITHPEVGTWEKPMHLTELGMALKEYLITNRRRVRHD